MDVQIRGSWTLDEKKINELHMFSRKLTHRPPNYLLTQIPHAIKTESLEFNLKVTALNLNVRKNNKSFKERERFVSARYPCIPRNVSTENCAEGCKVVPYLV